MLAAPVAVARKLGAGGEAEVFEIDGRPGLAYKRFRQPSRERTAKLRVMTAHPPAGLDDGGHVAIAWPIEVVETAGVAVGFTMPRIDTASTVPLFQVYNPQSRRQVAPAFSWRYLLRTARNVAAIVDAVHRAGYVIGDLNESNFLVSRRALVTLVDCDSLQVTDPASGAVHHCPVGKPEFLAPELQHVDLSSSPRTEASDRFALAVLLHLILLEGAHPFAGIWRGRGDPPDIGTRIARRAAAHHRRGPVDPAPFALDLSVLPHPLRRLFRQALGAGLRRPGARPSADQWLTALDAADRALRQCARSAHHVYAGHLRACPWCARLRRGLPDPFPGPQGGSGIGAPPPTVPERAMARLSAAQRWLARGGRAVVGHVRARLWAALSGAASAIWSWARARVGPPLRHSVPHRVAGAAAGVVAPVVVLSVVLVVAPGVSAWRASASPPPAGRGGRRGRWSTVRMSRRRWRTTRARIQAAGARFSSSWLTMVIVAGTSAGSAGLALAAGGWDGGEAGRLAAAVAGMLGSHRLPLVARPSPNRGDGDGAGGWPRRRSAGWIMRWCAAGMLVVLAWPVGLRRASVWPADAALGLVGRLVRLVL